MTEYTSDPINNSREFRPVSSTQAPLKRDLPSSEYDNDRTLGQDRLCLVYVRLHSPSIDGLTNCALDVKKKACPTLN